MPSGLPPSIPQKKSGSSSDKGGKGGKRGRSSGHGGQGSSGSGKGNKRGHICQKQLRRIRVVSFGLQTLDDRVWLAGKKNAEAAVLKACREECDDQDTAIVILDACTFSDVVQGRMDHFGTNGAIVSAIRNRASFKEWLRQARRSIYSGWKGRRKMIIAVYCQSGEHCSVALAVAIEHLLVHEGFHLFEEAVDISRHTLFRQQHLCRCESCRTPSDGLTAALETISQDWIGLELDAALKHVT